MRVATCGRNLTDLSRFLDAFPDLEFVDERPDIVIAYGGDGALLGAERVYPGIPKCPIRDSRSNPKCDAHAEAKVLELLISGELTESQLIRLQATTSQGQTITGTNDIVINKEIISSAVRYSLRLNDLLYKNHIVGDGLVVATPFGSTGYYRSITHSLFRVGIGLAFNNSTEPLDHLVIDCNSTVEVEIIRGPAVLLADNNPARLALRQGDLIRIRQTERETTVLGLDTFRCPDCYQLRQDSAGPSCDYTADRS